jgi:hypothetical protein
MYQHPKQPFLFQRQYAPLAQRHLAERPAATIWAHRPVRSLNVDQIGQGAAYVRFKDNFHTKCRCPG